MVTEMAKDQVIEIGVRNRAGYLLEQFGYTIGLARLEGEALSGLLPPRYIEELTEVGESVRTAAKDRAIAAEEAKTSTEQVNTIVRQAKEWRRAVVARAKRAESLGKKVPDGLLSTDGVKGVPAVATQMDRMVKLLEASADALGGGGYKALLADGESLADALKALDAEQEIKRLKQLPDKVREFYFHKGQLFLGIKVVNEAGHELHAHDPVASAKYNLSILHRNSSRKKKAAAAG